MSGDAFDRIATLAIHGGRSLESHSNSILFPIYQSTTFVHETVGHDKGFSYSRVGNPTVDALEQSLAALEGTPGAVCFRTGMAAITALFLSLLKTGDHAIVSDVVYGGTVRLFAEVLSGLGVLHTSVETADLAAVRAAVTPRTKVILIESPGNPTMKLTDIAGVAAIARQHGILLAVDNTFLTPVLQRPLELGADISVLSTTKYIEGHNSSVGGSLATRDAALLERFRLIRKTIGAIQAPQDAWLTLRGLKTLPFRMKLHSENAQKVATWLDRQPGISRVHYPGLDSFPQKALAARQQRAFGGMLAFELKAGMEAALGMMNAVKLCSRAESMGAVETLITHPASATHADIPVAERNRIGITGELVRISVGLEDPEDIVADLEQALAAALLAPRERAR